MFVVAVPAAQAAKGIAYKGKTSQGHKITFRYSKGKMYKLVTGVSMTCIPIQGIGKPQIGLDLWTADGLKTNLKGLKVTEKSPSSMYYNEVTKHHTVKTHRSRRGVITGSVRVQYSFLIPKYPIGTFTIYSCLGNMKFKAKPAR
jgi:hypothetical protein